MRPVDLETRVASDLRRLPSPRAPRTLLPRVLAAVQAWSMRPWYSREWFTWPLGWQVGSIGLLMAMLGGSAIALPVVQAVASAATVRVMSGAMTNMPQIVRGLELVSDVVLVLWRAVVQPFLTYALVLVGLMCLMCAMCAIALGRAVFGRALPS
jgi:hypothetical protein